jgi:hypothetical protein
METTKTKRRSKKAASAPAATSETSIVAAFGGAEAPAPAPAPALFVEEIDAPPVPTPVAKSKRATARKPPVVAAVTPDGIQGTLTPQTEQRPLIAHLPIHLSDIDNDLFAPAPATEETESTAVPPRPYDPEDIYANFSQSKSMPTAVATSAAAAPIVEELPARPSLPLHYSEKLMVRYQDANREQVLPESTEVVCFWDCHSFRGRPCVIPTTIEEGVWRVYGNFCCPECAAAYLFQERLDSHVQWERYALLNRLYAVGSESVRLAPPRTILRLFGGTMDIADYRKIVDEKRMRVDVMTPPMISIIQVMDTKPIDFYDASMKNNFIPWEMDRMNRPGAQGLRLRRTKPVAEKEATLEYCMGIVA